MRKIHASLTGTDADGTVFRLGEPEQLLWVHCAGVDSYVNICRRCGMDATPAQRDAFVAEQGRSAALGRARPGGGARLRGRAQRLLRVHAAAGARIR